MVTGSMKKNILFFSIALIHMIPVTLFASQSPTTREPKVENEESKKRALIKAKLNETKANPIDVVISLMEEQEQQQQELHTAQQKEAACQLELHKYKNIEVSVLAKDHDELQKKYKALKAQQETLAQELTATKKQAKECTLALDKVKPTTEKKGGLETEEQQELATIEAQSGQKSSPLPRITQQMEQYKAGVAKLEDDIRASDEHIKQLSLENTKLKQQLEEHTFKAQESKQQTTPEKSQEITKLKDQLKKSEGQQKELTALVKKIQDDYDKVQAELVDAKKQPTYSLQQQLATAKKELVQAQALARPSEELQKTITTQTEELEKALAEKKKLEQELSDAQQLKQSFEEQRNQAQKQLETELKKRKAQSVTEQMPATAKEDSEAKTRLEKNKQLIELAKKQIAQLVSQLNELLVPSSQTTTKSPEQGGTRGKQRQSG